MNILPKLLPTSENSIAYRHMLLFPAGKHTGIRKVIPKAIDFRINAVALIIFSTVDLILSATRLSLYVIFVIPMLKNDMKPILKDFFCSLATIVKATLAFFHGKNEGLLKLGSYQRMEKIAARDLAKAKFCLMDLSLPTSDAEKDFLRNIIKKIGVDNCLGILLKNNKQGMLAEVVELLNAKPILLELYINNLNRMTSKNRNTLFNLFECTENNFVKCILLDPSISDSIKSNKLAALCQIQTNLADVETAKNQIIPELMQAIDSEIQEFTKIHTELTTVQNKLNLLENEFTKAMKERSLEADYDDTPEELKSLEAEIDKLRKRRNAASAKEIQLKQSDNIKLYAKTLDNDILRILSLKPEMLEFIKPLLTPSLETILRLNSIDFSALLKVIPDLLAGIEDPNTGESLIMLCFNRGNYNNMLTLIRNDASKITIQTVFYLLQNGSKLFGISQKEMENILSTDHKHLVELYNEKETKLEVDSKTQAEKIGKLKTIGINSSINKFSLNHLSMELLLKREFCKMLYKASPIPEPVLDDIPTINIVRDGEALAKSVGVYTPSLTTCLKEIEGSHNARISIRSNTPDHSLRFKMKHIIQKLKNMHEQNQDIDLIQSMLSYLDTEGNPNGGNLGCIGMKQNVVNSIWRKINNTTQDTSNSQIERLDIYLSGFADNIASKVPEPDAHERMKWHKTLATDRMVTSLDPGTKDFFYGTPFTDANSHAWHTPKALTFFDDEYRPEAFIAFLRQGLKAPQNRLEGGITDTILEFYKKLGLDSENLEREKLEALMTEYNGQFTDFALFCVLVHLGYIGI